MRLGDAGREGNASWRSYVQLPLTRHLSPPFCHAEGPFPARSAVGKHKGKEKSEKTQGEIERPEAELGFSHHGQLCSGHRRRLRRSCRY